MSADSPTEFFSITAYGAVGDGLTMNTAAIQAAVDACAAAGGGTVFCPAGVFLTGTLLLRSNISLFLSSGCTIRGSTDLGDIRSPRTTMDFRCLIGAAGQENVVICGYGTIDAQGESYWQALDYNFISQENEYYFGRDRVGWGEVLHHWWKPKFRYGRCIGLTGCRGCKIHDVTIRNSPAFGIHLHGCDSVMIRGVTIHNPLHGPNTDGIDIDSCHEVLISDCDIHTADDAICLKSIGLEGLRRTCRNITVTNCRLTTVCNAFKMGTESLDGFENITFSNSVIHSIDEGQQYKALGGVVIESVDGAKNSSITVSNIAMTNVRAPLFVRLGARGRKPGVAGASFGAVGDFTPGEIKNLTLANITAVGATITSSVTGLAGCDIENLTMSNITLEVAGGECEELSLKPVPERPQCYPETTMYGKGAASALYCRHVRGLSVNNIRVAVQNPDGRAVLIFDDVKRLDLSGVDAPQPSGEQPVISLRGCPDPFLYGVRDSISRDIMPE